MLIRKEKAIRLTRFLVRGSTLLKTDGRKLFAVRPILSKEKEKFALPKMLFLNGLIFITRS
jgi:hypothetical protein